MLPITVDVFNDQVQVKSESVQRETRRRETAEEIDQNPGSPYQCLFCQQKFEHDNEEFENTLKHMFTTHGLFIPDHTTISDLGCFLGYLATEVRVWHECLYCGTTKNSTLAIQSHMRDSSHCMLNLEREPELLEFWECRVDGVGNAAKNAGRSRMGSGKELQLLGTVGGPRWNAQEKTRARRARDVRLALQAGLKLSTSPEPPGKQNSRQLARRDEMSIQNIDSQQRHALILAEKRSQKDEAMAKRANEWS